VSFSAPHFELTEDEPDARTRVITVTGEIHVSTAPDFSRRLNDAIGTGKTWVILDLSDVAFIDSTGLSVLLNGMRRLNRMRGHMTLVCSNPTVLRLFQVTRLDSTFEILATREEALERVKSGPPPTRRRQAGEGGSTAGAP
jgi:anti-sigma B factor antagonist